MVPAVRGSQEKLRGSGKVREFKSTRVQKLKKMQKNLTIFPARFAYKLFVPPF